MDQIINNILLTYNLTSVLRIYKKTYNLTVKILKYIIILIFLIGVVTLSYNKVYEKLFSPHGGPQDPQHLCLIIYWLGS